MKIRKKKKKKLIMIEVELIKRTNANTALRQSRAEWKIESHHSEN